MTKLFIAEIRKDKGLTQKELAERLNVPQSSISRWEQGKHLPTLEQFIEIAKALETTLDELIGRR